MGSEDGSAGIPDFGDNIDQGTFEQILEMDEDEDRDFSKSIVFGFFEQVETTFGKIDAAIKTKDLKQLSQLGHFLKGSSATLGLTKIKTSCEKIQHFGHGKDETGTKDEKPDVCLKLIKNEMVALKKDYATVEVALKKFYAE